MRPLAGGFAEGRRQICEIDHLGAASGREGHNDSQVAALALVEFGDGHLAGVEVFFLDLVDAHVVVVVVGVGIALHGRKVFLGRQVALLERKGLLCVLVLGIVHGSSGYPQGLAVVVVQVGGGNGAVRALWAHEGGFFEGPLLELR